MAVPSLLCSWVGSTRASTAVLSQIDPAPGAEIAAQTEPEDCGRAPPFAAFSATSSAIVVGSRVTVMSAPTRVSQNGDTDCLTDTADAPFGLSPPDHAIPLPVFPLPVMACCAADGLGAAAAISVDTSTLSWLQSRLLTSMPVMSTSSASAARVSAGRVSVLSSAAGAAGSSVADVAETDCARAGHTEAIASKRASAPQKTNLDVIDARCPRRIPTSNLPCGISSATS